MRRYIKSRRGNDRTVQQNCHLHTSTGDFRYMSRDGNTTDEEGRPHPLEDMESGPIRLQRRTRNEDARTDTQSLSHTHIYPRPPLDCNTVLLSYYASYWVKCWTL